MTENKRFECDKGSRIIIDNESKLHYIMTLDWECSLVTKLLNRFAEENKNLKAQLYCNSDEGVCTICENHYLVESGKYFVSNCRKGHDECSKESLRYCEDFEVLKGDVE